MRLTADGKLHLCLLHDAEIDLRGVLRGGGTQADIERLLRRAVAEKPVGHQLADGLHTQRRDMVQIGG